MFYVPDVQFVRTRGVYCLLDLGCCECHNSLFIDLFMDQFVLCVC